MKEIIYSFIRMWAPADDCIDWEEPHYVQQVQEDKGPVRWTLTRDFEIAHKFKHLRAVRRVVKNVRRVASRIQDGWIYEIIRVKEEVVESNVPEKEESHEV